MPRRTRTTLLALGALAATAPASAQAQAPRTHPMAMPHPGAAAATTPNPGQVRYFGGPVIGTPRVLAVLWSDQVDPAIRLGIGPFLRSLPTSTYQDLLAQYSTAGVTPSGGGTGTTQTIARGRSLGVFTITPANTSPLLSDRDIRRELAQQIAAHHLPAPNPNTLYMVYFPASIFIVNGAAGLGCFTFAAYHGASTKTPTPTTILYGVMPDCGLGFDFITIASSHEYAEAVTDPYPTPGTHPAPPQAWNDAGGNEIGDLCQDAPQATLKTPHRAFAVQSEFDNTSGTCTTQNFHSP